MIIIIDYGMGNLRSVQKGFEKIGQKATITSNPREVLKAKKVVLPGVGAFKNGMENLKKYGLIDPIYQTIKDGKPFLGICLGLQFLFTKSEEFGNVEGLGIIPGKVVRFSTNLPSPNAHNNGQEKLKVPHMGWNTIDMKQKNALFHNIEDHSYFYFVHSYYVVPEDNRVISTTTNYGITFTSSICKDTIYACQFHPEKSQRLGLKILKNFGELS
ncbi:MAG: imidazole glycerol phosphate synthase subunit HisH [Thermodesulfobacteriota bacterium]|nr:imidazole glycerol phosphate synthase subunit HisH [Thermodesulfobacteriota bacterium]